jgi:hypothetical protein
MKRTPIARKTPIARTGRVRPRNDARREREFARSYGSRERVLWVQSLPCCRCGRRPSDNAHTENGGRGRKGDATVIAPLCRPCHRAYDEHRAPFDQSEARERVRVHAAVTAAQWDAMGAVCR